MKGKCFRTNQKRSIFLAGHGLDNTLPGIDMTFGGDCRTVSQLEITEYIISAVCATIKYEYHSFRVLSDRSNGGSLVNKQSRAAFSYDIDTSSERQPLSGSSSARQVSARTTKSRDSQDRGVTLGLRRNTSYSRVFHRGCSPAAGLPLPPEHHSGMTRHRNDIELYAFLYLRGRPLSFSYTRTYFQPHR